MLSGSSGTRRQCVCRGAPVTSVCFWPEAAVRPRPEAISYPFSLWVCFRPKADVREVLANRQCAYRLRTGSRSYCSNSRLNSYADQ